MRRRRGFSIIELLVVISIIILLIAMLLPSLGRARETARAAMCESNTRQLGVAANNYSNDYDGYFPSSRLWTLHSTGIQSYVSFPVNHSWEHAWHTPEALLNGILWPYAQQRNLWLCPTFMQVKDIGAEPAFQCGHTPQAIDVQFSYSMNGSIVGHVDASWNGWRVGRFSEVLRPSELLFISEENTWRVVPGSGWQLNDGLFGPGPDNIATFHLPVNLSDRNSGSGTVLFVDGHAEQRFWHETLVLGTQ